MNNDHRDLPEKFGSLDSEELLRMHQSNTLTDAAQEILLTELLRRGIDISTTIKPDAQEQTSSAGEFLTVAKYAIPTEAHIVQECLVAAGVPAVVIDANLVQTNSLLTIAVGGVRVMVPANCMARALEVIEAFNRGEYQLDDDFDVGEQEQ